MKIQFQEKNPWPWCKIVTNNYTSCNLIYTPNLKRAIDWINAQNWEDNLRGYMLNKLSSQYLDQFFSFASVYVNDLNSHELKKLLQITAEVIKNYDDWDIIQKFEFNNIGK
jgi:hypothetical protein